MYISDEHIVIHLPDSVSFEASTLREFITCIIDSKNILCTLDDEEYISVSQAIKNNQDSVVLVGSNIDSLQKSIDLSFATSNFASRRRQTMVSYHANSKITVHKVSFFLNLAITTKHRAIKGRHHKAT